MQQITDSLMVTADRQGLQEITPAVLAWLDCQGIGDGLLTLFIRHTSASLLIQENAAPAARRDLERWIATLAPEHGGYEHDEEGLDDMPAHLRSAITQTHLAIPVQRGRLMLGTWQGIYLFEHRLQPSPREIALHLLGKRMNLASMRTWLAEHAPEVRLVEAHGSSPPSRTLPGPLRLNPLRWPRR